MKTNSFIAAITIAFATTALSDVGFVKGHLASLVHFADQHNANLLVYDQYDQARGLAVLSPERILDIPTELKSFVKPKFARARPSLSFDGAKVAFAQGAPGGVPQEICIFNLRTRAAEKIAEFPAVLSVTWSPGGDVLAVNMGGGQLRTLLLATKQSKLIANNISSDTPSWSPDGKKVTYESASGTGENRSFHVNVIEVGTGRIEKIAEGRYPSWSPLGDRIAYLDQKKQIYMAVSSSGGQSSPLLRRGKKIPGDPILSEPVVWSPDGRQIIVTGYYDGGTSLTLVDLTTSKRTVLHSGGDWLLASWR